MKGSLAESENASFADQLKEKVVKYHSDNQNVMRALF